MSKRQRQESPLIGPELNYTWVEDLSPVEVEEYRLYAHAQWGPAYGELMVEDLQHILGQRECPSHETPLNSETSAFGDWAAAVETLCEEVLTHEEGSEA